jgi:hypothetical protein
MECNEQLHTCVNNALYEDISKFDACFTAFTDCLPPVSGREIGGIPPPPPMTSTIEEPTASTSPKECADEYRSCLDNASTLEGKRACGSRLRSCLGPKAAVTFIEEIHGSNEAQYDTTTSDLNTEGYGLRGNFLKND